MDSSLAVRAKLHRKANTGLLRQVYPLMRQIIHNPCAKPLVPILHNCTYRKFILKELVEKKGIIDETM